MSSASILEDDDDAIFDNHVVKIGTVAVVEKSTLRDLLSKAASASEALEVEFIDHAFPDKITPIKEAQIIFLECRLLEMYEDLTLLREIRRERPLAPIAAVGENEDPDFIMEILKAGATDYFSVNTYPEIVGIKVLSLHKLSESARLIEVQNQEVVNSLKAQREANEKRMKAEADKAIAQVQAEANRQTKEILDNLHEGFFFVGQDLKIGEVTSASCKKIFGKEIASQMLGDSLGVLDKKENYMAQCLVQVYDDFLPMEVSVNLLPKIVETKDNKIIEMKYTVLMNDSQTPNRVIVSAADITKISQEKRRLENENNLNKALLKILRKTDVFKEYLRDFRENLKKMETTTTKDIAFRILHTLKGNSAAFGVQQVVDAVHVAESWIQLVEEQKFPKATMDAFLAEISKTMDAFLQENENILHLKDDMDVEASYPISESKLKVLSRIAEHLPHDDRVRVEGILQDTCKKPIYQFTAQFREDVERIAQKMEKSVNFIEEGTQIRIEDQKFGTFLRSLIHFIRNSVDHGIETKEDRIDAGKSPEGTLKMKFDNDDPTTLVITISDDGRGLNRDRIISKAIEKKLITADQSHLYQGMAFVKLIFLPGFSTADQITETSGRGIGLDCVREEVKKLGGTIGVWSKEGKGTKFTINLPLDSTCDL